MLLYFSQLQVRFIHASPNLFVIFKMFQPDLFDCLRLSCRLWVDLGYLDLPAGARSVGRLHFLGLYESPISILTIEHGAVVQLGEVTGALVGPTPAPRVARSMELQLLLGTWYTEAVIESSGGIGRRPWQQLPHWPKKVSILGVLYIVSAIFVERKVLLSVSHLGFVMPVADSVQEWPLLFAIH